VVSGLIHDLLGQVSEVEPGGSALIGEEGLAEDQQRGAISSEGVFHEGDRLEVDFGVLGVGLLGGGTIVCPPLQITQLADVSLIDLGLGSQVLRPVHPNVLGDGHVPNGGVPLVEVEVEEVLAGRHVLA